MYLDNRRDQKGKKKYQTMFNHKFTISTQESKPDLGDDYDDEAYQKLIQGSNANKHHLE